MKMGQRKIAKTRRLNGVSDETLDALVRQYIRLFSRGYCKRCKKWVGDLIEVAHLYGRRRKTVRWDLRNVCPLCPECHRLIDNDCVAKSSFMYDVMSKKEIANLQELASKTIKQYPIDRDAIKAGLRRKIKQLKEIENDHTTRRD